MTVTDEEMTGEAARALFDRAERELTKLTDEMVFLAGILLNGGRRAEARALVETYWLALGMTAENLEGEVLALLDEL